MNFFLSIFIAYFILTFSVLADEARDPHDRSDTSMEDGALQKHRGLTEKTHDSLSVKRDKLMTDIEQGKLINVIKFLQDEKTLNFITDSGLNPLVHAGGASNLAIVKMIVEDGKVPIDSEDELGDTALIKASAKGNAEIIIFLLEKGANINHQNKSGITSVMKAAEKSNFYILKLLLENNADIDTSDYTGRTVREIAENSRDKRIKQLLN